MLGRGGQLAAAQVLPGRLVSVQLAPEDGVQPGAERGGLEGVEGAAARPQPRPLRPAPHLPALLLHRVECGVRPDREDQFPAPGPAPLDVLLVELSHLGLLDQFVTQQSTILPWRG